MLTKPFGERGHVHGALGESRLKGLGGSQAPAETGLWRRNAVRCGASATASLSRITLILIHPRVSALPSVLPRIVLPSCIDPELREVRTILLLTQLPSEAEFRIIRGPFQTLLN